jgi:uncharacterized protein
MALNITASFSKYPYAYANWGRLLLMLTGGVREVVVTGEKAPEFLSGLQQHYLPGAVWAASLQKSDIPLLKNRTSSDKTLIYVCSNGSCRFPVETVKAALELLN